MEAKDSTTDPRSNFRGHLSSPSWVDYEPRLYMRMHLARPSGQPDSCALP